MQPYENTYVSSFVFALGYIACRRGLELESAWAASFAQAKADQTIGDLVLGWTGRKFIFEFKRDLAAVSTELKKPIKAALLKKLYDPGQKLNLERANRSHFLAYGVSGHEDGLKFAQYASLFKGLPKNGPSMGVFIERAVFNAECGLDDREFRSYLELLCECAGTESANSGGRAPSVETGVLVVSYDQATGKICFASIDLALGLSIPFERSPPLDLGVPFHGRGGPSKGRGGPGL